MKLSKTTLIGIIASLFAVVTIVMSIAGYAAEDILKLGLPLLSILTAGGFILAEDSKKAAAFLLVTGLAVMSISLTGCASGKQGQGDTRQVNVTGVYAESLVVQGDDLPRFVEKQLGGANPTVDQSNTYQPSTEGTNTATNQPTVSPTTDISGTGL